MDPITLSLIPLATQALKVVEQAQISFNTAPAEYRDQYYKRLAKLEALWDPVIEKIAGHLAKNLDLKPGGAK
jgi:hypothetical protein